MNLIALIDQLWDRHHGSRVRRAGWPAATTLADLGQLMARWLEGGISVWPGYYGSGPDEETLPHIPALAAACRAGYVTVQSQAGTSTHVDGYPVTANAVVEGFASPAVAAAIERRCQLAGLVVHINTVAIRWWSACRRRGPWGLHLTPGEIDFLFTGCSPAALAALTAATQVTVYDPEPGRDILWAVIADAVRETDRT